MADDADGDIYRPVHAVFEAMQTETLRGVPLNTIVGGNDPLVIARHYMEMLTRHAGLTPADRVLDIGCGCGRLAAALTQHLTSGSYLGVDILPGLVDFCRRHIADRYPNFRFLSLGQANATYDYFRTEKADLAALSEACAPDSIDLCIATSLFTHLDARSTKDMLTALKPLVDVHGRVFMTAFLLDPSTRYLITQRQPELTFINRTPERGVWVQKAEEPSFATAFEFPVLSGIIAEAGFYIERALFGSWTKRPRHVSFQDILVLGRRW